jgi:hypothetical protein
MEWTARIRFTASQKAELWKRWRSGQCVADIARVLGRRNKSGVYRVLALNGGIMTAGLVMAEAQIKNRFFAKFWMCDLALRSSRLQWPPFTLPGRHSDRRQAKMRGSAFNEPWKPGLAKGPATLLSPVALPIISLWIWFMMRAWGKGLLLLMVNCSVVESKSILASATIEFASQPWAARQAGRS